MCGVLTNVLPDKLMSPNPWSSVMMRMIFGRLPFKGLASASMWLPNIIAAARIGRMIDCLFFID
jgi:hypothetical protein